MRAVIVVPADLLEERFCGRAVAEYLIEVGAAASLAAEVVTPVERVDGPAPFVLIDGRYLFSIAAEKVRDFACGGSDRLADAQDRTIARRCDAGGVARDLIALADGVETIVEDAIAVRDAYDVAIAAGRVQAAIVERLGRTGVRFVAPHRAIVDATVRVAPGAQIGADVTLQGATVIGRARVEQGCVLIDTQVADGATVKPYSVCEGAVVGPGANVGPMAHLRLGAVLETDAKVGNFVEVKNTILHDGAKASHLTYLGDAEVGAGANIGAGTITCNYDGHAKHRTTIGARAFIGSNTALVAPVAVGEGAVVGAGSVITKDVPADALALERSEQRTLAGMGRKLDERNRLAAALAKQR